MAPYHLNEFYLSRQGTRMRCFCDEGPDTLVTGELQGNAIGFRQVFLGEAVSQFKAFT